MLRETIAEAPSVEEALDSALEQLGVQQDAVEYEVLEGGGRGVFGLGADKPARVKVWLRSDFVVPGDEEEPAEEEPAKPQAARYESVERGSLTEEELDKVADEAVSTIEAILVAFGIEGTIEEYEGDEDEIILDIVGADLGVLIGRHGRTLDSLQILVSAITNRRIGFRYPVLVDVEGYRNRRKSKLEEIAGRAAERAIRQDDAVRLRPMSSLERRVVHMCLRDDARVSTESEGEEPFRAVVVKPK